MKVSKVLIVGVLAALAVSAQLALANGPGIRPNPVMEYDQPTVEILNALGANAGDFAELMKHGNMISQATVHQLSEMITVYSVTVQRCTTGGIVGFRCIGGARLTIVNRHERQGSMVVEKYETDLALLR